VGASADTRKLAEEEAVRSLNSGIGYQQARNFLRAFSEQTGGFAYFPRFPAEIPELSRSITAFLRSEYTLSFSPPDSARDGKYHRLTIQIVGSDGKPLMVPDPSGKLRKISATARQGYQLLPLEETKH
jgi:hypothetical protein